MIEKDMLTNDIPFAHLDDRPLLDAAKRLASNERHATATFLRALMEIDSRRLYLGEGCASMFAYCTQVLHLSEGGAYNRIEASRAARAYPVVLELFEQSSITLTAIRLLAPHLTSENHVAVLTSARHKSKREIEALVVTFHPEREAPATVRKLPAAHRPQPPSPVASAVGRGLSAPPSSSETIDQVSWAVSSDRPSLPARIAPLAADRYRIQLTVSRETHDKFRRAQALLRHAIPSGDPAEIFDRAITLLVQDAERRRFAEASKPRVSSRTQVKNGRSRHLPAAVRREVWRRDSGRCAFVGREGRCRETAFLEFHHTEPYATGGEATVSNIQLRCRAHNAYEAQLFFGNGIVREARSAWGTHSSRNEFGATRQAVLCDAQRLQERLMRMQANKRANASVCEFSQWD